MKLDLPKYVCPRPRKNGTMRFYFRVPKHVRPEGWTPTLRLSDDIVEMFKQAETLNQRLKAERTTGEPLAPQINRQGTIPWLLERYYQSTRYKNLAKSTKELYGFCAKDIYAWSKKAGHPHVKHITRPLIFRFLEQFVSTKEANRYTRDQFSSQFGRVANAAGLSHCVFRTLRHTAIVRLARAGCTHSEIASVSGHTDASVANILRRYLPRDTKVADNAISKLESTRATEPKNALIYVK